MLSLIIFDRLSGSPPFQSKDEDGLYEIIKTVDVSKLYSDKAIWKSVTDEGMFVRPSMSTNSSS